MNASRRAVRLAPLAVAAALAACVGGRAIPRSELPEAPLAFLYRTEDEGRQRAEEQRAAREGREPPRGIADWEDLGRLVGRGDSGAGGVGLEGRLALLDPRTGEPDSLRALPRGAVPLSWSADRTRLLYVSATRGRHQLFELDTGSREVRQVTLGPDRHLMGCYLPDDRLVVARAERAGRGELMLRLRLTRPGGGRSRSLTDGPWDAFPACSPDGQRVAFARARGRGGERVAVVELSSREVRELAPGTHPTFTPDGDWIVYSARTSKGHRIWRMRPDGTGKAPLGTRFGSEAVEAAPAVSPDGRFFAYVLKENDRDSLRLRRIDGKGDRPLLEFGDGTSPVW